MIRRRIPGRLAWVSGPIFGQRIVSARDSSETAETLSADHKILWSAHAGERFGSEHGCNPLLLHASLHNSRSWTFSDGTHISQVR